MAAPDSLGGPARGANVQEPACSAIPRIDRVAHRLVRHRTPRVPASSSRMMADWDALGGAIQGEVVLPESADYDLLRTPPMARFWDVRPAAVVRCRTSADVAEAL